MGALVGDVVITRDEIRGLMAGLLCVDSPATGTTRLSDWAAEHAESLGKRYASELARRRDRWSDYAEGPSRKKTPAAGTMRLALRKTGFGGSKPKS